MKTDRVWGPSGELELLVDPWTSASLTGGTWVCLCPKRVSVGMGQALGVTHTNEEEPCE